MQCLANEVFYFAGAIKKAVFTVDMEMNEVVCVHKLHPIEFDVERWKSLIIRA